MIQEDAPALRNAEKLRIMKVLLLQQDSVFMHLSPAGSGAEMTLPPHLKGQVQVVLQVGLNMPVPIPDINVDDWGFYGTLSFKGVPFTCRIPWRSVFALVGSDGRGKTWEADMPPPILEQVEQERVKRTRLQDLGGGKADETATTSPYLKAIKPAKRPRPDWMHVIDGDGGKKEGEG